MTWRCLRYEFYIQIHFILWGVKPQIDKRDIKQVLGLFKNQNYKQKCRFVAFAVGHAFQSRFIFILFFWRNIFLNPNLCSSAAINNQQIIKYDSFFVNSTNNYFLYCNFDEKS